MTDYSTVDHVHVFSEKRALSVADEHRAWKTLLSVPCALCGLTFLEYRDKEDSR